MDHDVMRVEETIRITGRGDLFIGTVLSVLSHITLVAQGIICYSDLHESILPQLFQITQTQQRRSAGLAHKDSP